MEKKQYVSFHYLVAQPPRVYDRQLLLCNGTQVAGLYRSMKILLWSQKLQQEVAEYHIQNASI